MANAEGKTADRADPCSGRTLSGRLRGGLLVVLLAIAGCSPPPPPERPSQAPQLSDGRAGSPQGAPKPSGEGGSPATDPWDVDLRRDEQRGGHTIERHVGRTDAQLKARLQRESISAASTYADLENAERVVARALADNARRVQRWIDQRSPKTNLAVRYRARDGLPTGRLLRRGADASRDVTGAVVVLRWRGEDWYVLTSYPENPR
jgi:Bacterial CdiA-CT RNAse A domain